MKYKDLKQSTLFSAAVDKILLVDDDPASHQILELHIHHSLGYETIIAENGQIALGKIRKYHPSLILLDLLMPVMDGAELLRILKSDSELKDIPVIIISGIDDINRVLECIEMGATDYLYKPINFKLLDARIKSCLNQSRDRCQENLYRKKLERAVSTINRQKNELLNANKLITKFSRICSHEFKNTLLPIYAYSDFLLNDDDFINSNNEENIHAIGIISKNASQMKDLLTDAQDYQNILSDKVHLNIGPFDFNQLLCNTLDSYEILFHEKKISIQSTLTPHLPKALGDTIRATQVIGNFLTNALKFSNPNSRIHIRTQIAGNSIRMEIEDEGPGVIKSERSLLFREDAKISNKPTAKESSTGLGLAIVKRLVESQNGRVGARFPKAKGSIFWFELPVDNSGFSGSDTSLPVGYSASN